MTTMQLAFSHLNLRYNPFGALEPAAWAQAAVLLDSLELSRVGLPGHVTMFIGAQGRGKSTHMRALWGAAGRRAPFVYIGEGEGWWARVPTGALVFVDEAQRLPRWRRWLLWRRRGASLVVGTHEDHTAELEAAGLIVQRVIVAGLDDARLDEILRRRIGLARRDEGPAPWVGEQARRRLLDEHGDDLRAIVGRLYDVFQALDSPRCVRAEEL